jgi:hypothetical protein
MTVTWAFLISFDEMVTPPFEIRERWDLPDFIGYLGTWSAASLFLKKTRRDPIDEVRSELEAAWAGSFTKREVVWPIHLRVGRLVEGLAS